MSWWNSLLQGFLELNISEDLIHDQMSLLPSLYIYVWRLPYNFQIVAGNHANYNELVHVDFQYSYHSNDGPHCEGCSRWTERSKLVSKNTAAAPFLRFHFPSILHWNLIENFCSFSWYLQMNAAIIPNTFTVMTPSFMILTNLLLYMLLFC